jgi:hypothetical protein
VHALRHNRLLAIAKKANARAGRIALILGLAIEEGGIVVPELTTCDQCGRTVIVLSWAPVYEDLVQLTEADDSHSLEIDCKIDCPTCGTRIQSVAPVEPA